MFPHVRTLLAKSQSIPVKYELTVRARERFMSPDNYHICFINSNHEAYLFHYFAKATEEYGPMMGEVNEILVDQNVYYMRLKYLDYDQEFVATDKEESKQQYSLLQKYEPSSIDYVKMNLYIQQYHELKERILYNHLTYSILGTVATRLVTHDALDTISFGCGGIIGVIYQVLLQLDMDSIGQKNANVLVRLVANGAVRMTCIGSIIAIMLNLNDQINIPLLLGGLWMHKLAVITSSIRSTD